MDQNKKQDPQNDLRERQQQEGPRGDQPQPIDGSQDRGYSTDPQRLETERAAIADLVFREAARELTDNVLRVAIAEYDSQPTLRESSRLYPYLVQSQVEREEARRGTRSPEDVRQSTR